MATGRSSFRASCRRSRRVRRSRRSCADSSVSRRCRPLLRNARRAGLLARGPVSYGDMGTIGVADAPTTTVHLNAAGRRVVRDAYALGFAAGGSRLPPAQAAARRALDALHRRSAERPRRARATSPTRPRRLRRALRRAGTTRDPTGRLAARARSGDGRKEGVERLELSLHHASRGRRERRCVPACAVRTTQSRWVVRRRAGDRVLADRAAACCPTSGAAPRSDASSGEPLGHRRRSDGDVSFPRSSSTPVHGPSPSRFATTACRRARRGAMITT